VLQTETAMEQDIVEANFNGTLFALPAGDVSGAVGYQYRRDAGQFTPDNLQATNSFLDQAVGLYPLGTLQNPEIAAKDGYLELFIPVLKDLPGLKKLDLDIGGRYSDYSATPNAVTFKVNVDAQITNALRVRAGYNRATRAPNLGELYLGEQEYFAVGGNVYGDPCSLRSTAPFGAGGAAADTSLGSSSRGPTALAAGQTAAGALSTYLICQAQMGGLTSTAGQAYYGVAAQSQAGTAFNWLNEQGNANLKSETANTWTAGIVFAQLSDSPWLAGFSGSVDWWQVNIQNAIELSDSDVSKLDCRHQRGTGRSAGGDAGVSEREPKHRYWRSDHDAADVFELGQHRHGGCGRGVELDCAVLRHGPEGGPGRPEPELAGHLPGLLPHQELPGGVRRDHRLEGLAGTQPRRYQRRCVRLPFEPRHRLGATLVCDQPALEVPAFGEHGGACAAAGHHRERQQGRRGCTGHAAELHAGQHHRREILECV
jgi:hypothetical protein